jgi:hypothetical protein
MKRFAAVVLLLGAPVSIASAQSLVPPTVRVRQAAPTMPADPGFELALHTGLSVVDTFGGILGIRVTRNFSDVIAGEVTVDRVDITDGHRRHVAELGVRTLFASRNGRRTYLSAGLAAGSGLPQAWSPVIGIGSQTDWTGPCALRAELQLLTRPFERPDGYGRSVGWRVNIGLAIGIQ